jgi:HlyD family secretion protein
LKIGKGLSSIWSLFNKEYKVKFVLLQVLIVIAALLEVLAIVGIGPFVSVVLGVIKIEDVPFIGIFIVENFQGNEIYTLGIIVGTIIIASNLFFAYTLYKKAKFSYGLGANISNNILKIFIADKTNINNTTKDKLLSDSTFETDRFSKSVVNELMQINARLIVSIAIMSYLLFVYGVSFLFVMGYIFSIYVIITLIIRKRLIKSGRELTANNKFRLKNINQVYDLFFEIKSYSSENYFVKKQTNYNKQISENLSKIEILSILPRYMVEAIIFVSLIAFVSYMYSTGDNVSNAIPTGVELIYGIMKLIPQVSNIYQAFSNLTGNINAVESIIKHQVEIKEEKNNTQSCTHIQLENINFKYEDQRVLNDFSYSFEKNKIYSIKGVSGSGKSTLLLLIFGILKPFSGKVNFLNNNSIINFPKVAYVPQKSFLSAGTIFENIALGKTENEIVKNNINEILFNLNLKEYIDNESDELQLSGGQIQRVSIGRALYSNYDILLMDEPTSALDPENERSTFKLLETIKNDKIIIIISHSDVVDEYVDEIIRIDKC